ncbi:MAG TPA: hypothetical protein VMK84_19010 [Streptosporangiaceae bacterium]|nr:hypothetical protein [Streptosporangiaceae bacterium]
MRWNLGQVRRLLGRPDALRGRVLSLRGADVVFDVDLLTKGRWQDAVELPALGAVLQATAQLALGATLIDAGTARPARRRPPGAVLARRSADHRPAIRNAVTST